MLQTILKDLKIASSAGKIIRLLTIARNMVFIIVVIIFLFQIGSFLIKEKA